MFIWHDGFYCMAWWVGVKFANIKLTYTFRYTINLHACVTNRKENITKIMKTNIQVATLCFSFLQLTSILFYLPPCK